VSKQFYFPHKAFDLWCQFEKSDELKPSKNWLGNYSTKDKIRRSGLWQVNELYKEALTEQEFETLKQLLR
jgi:hypothetical protein